LRSAAERRSVPIRERQDPAALSDLSSSRIYMEAALMATDATIFVFLLSTDDQFILFA